MRKRMRTLGILIGILFLAFAFTAGCAKKQTLQEGAGAGPAGAEIKAASEKPGPTPEELAAMEKAKALKEQELREQAERERLAREQAEKERLEKEKAAAEAEKAAKAMESALEDIHFDFDQFSLTSEARKSLQKHAAWLSAHPNAGVVIEGHCDSRGTTEYNLALGERRASETLKFLAALGISRSRMKTISYGEEMPLDPAETEAAWGKNRRVHFVVNSKM